MKPGEDVLMEKVLEMVLGIDAMQGTRPPGLSCFFFFFLTLSPVKDP